MDERRDVQGCDSASSSSRPNHIPPSAACWVFVHSPTHPPTLHTYKGVIAPLLLLAFPISPSASCVFFSTSAPLLRLAAKARVWGEEEEEEEEEEEGKKGKGLRGRRRFE